MEELKIDPYKALHSIVKTTSSFIAEDFLEVMCLELKKLFNADLVFITQAIEINPTTNVKIIAASQADIKNVEFNLDDTPCKLVYEKGVISIKKDVYINFEKSKPFGWESFLGLPIYNLNRHCIGHISIFSSKQRSFPNITIEIAKVFSGRIEVEAKRVALEKEKNDVYEKLYLQSISDELTKLYNRRYFTKKVEEIHDIVKRGISSARISFFDIDDFKNLNDIYGHDEGDYVLETIGRIFKNNHRNNVDFIFRMGGEEFCIITLNSSKKELEIYLKRLNEEVKEAFKDKAYKVTFSIGVAKLSKNHLTWQEAYKKADDKMYKAKLKGKNTIIF